MKKIVLAAFLSCFVTTFACGDDDTWHNVYHSLKRFFVGEDHKTQTVHHSRKSGKRSHHSQKAVAKASPTPMVLPSANPEGSPASTTGSSASGEQSAQQGPGPNQASEEDQSSAPAAQGGAGPQPSPVAPAPATQRKATAQPTPSAQPPAQVADPKPAAQPTPTPERERPVPTPNPTPEQADPDIKESTGSMARSENSVASLRPQALQEFPDQPPQVQQLIRNALALTHQGLSYRYGSADPNSGGMDCSGFIYYVLKNAGYDAVPRDSSEQYAWARKNGEFHAVLSRSIKTFELDDLKPGDLMFWSGTYKTEREIPITHVMIYLGKEKKSGKPVMVGASEGRIYDGVRRFGVSVFDFKMPSGKSNEHDPDLVPKFEGYASIPGLREPALTASSTKTQVNLQEATPTPKKHKKPHKAEE
jgi:cell wall-associated NlpC family hydrolase